MARSKKLTNVDGSPSGLKVVHRRYNPYRSAQPITAENLAQAELRAGRESCSYRWSKLTLS
jgi:hypothetical protein